MLPDISVARKAVGVIGFMNDMAKNALRFCHEHLNHYPLYRSIAFLCCLQKPIDCIAADGIIIVRVVGKKL